MDVKNSQNMEPQSSPVHSSQDPAATGTRATFTASDGETLQYKSWQPAGGFSRALVLLHRGHDHAPPRAALVLATPAFEVKLYVPGALAATRLLLKVKPDATIKSYVKGTWLTRDEAEQRTYDADTTISKDISARILIELFDSAQRVIADAAVMTQPLLL